MKETFEEYHLRVRELEGKLQMMDKRIEEIALIELYAPKVRKLRCFKGIDFLTALTLVVEVGDFKRFKSAEGILQRREKEAGRDYEGGEYARAEIVGGIELALSLQLTAVARELAGFVWGMMVGCTA